jgi:hypothetical protein
MKICRGEVEFLHNTLESKLNYIESLTETQKDTEKAIYK